MYFGPKITPNCDQWYTTHYLCEQNHLSQILVHSLHNWDNLPSSICIYRELLSWQRRKIGISKPKRTPNCDYRYITDYLCEQSHVNYISVHFYKQLRQSIIIYMHVHRTGSQLEMENRDLRAQKCPKLLIFIYKTSTMQTKSCRAYVFQLIQI